MTLTARQEQVISLIARGLTDKEIASELSISISTVEFHVGVILRSLDAKSRANAVAIRFVPDFEK